MDLSPFHLWRHLGWPLTRLFLSPGLGLMVTLFTQSLKWTKKIAAAQPLARQPLLAAAHFAICGFSGMAANTMLIKGYNNKTMDRKERILAKLFTR
ncbi:hypothetical protein [Desulfobulbus oralis]|uniref:Uncharacterized protein n=1 Tax=Desulfobulbus oralis TaxID=1986146 RepID=A0A2L1GPG1_9BACT|nr:hypothetical protein [Desulfobulbus oralis]AVD71573.1 hypothetical protein CAY53_08915 [Desulfobulbus oralis]